MKLVETVSRTEYALHALRVYDRRHLANNAYSKTLPGVVHVVSLLRSSGVRSVCKSVRITILLLLLLLYLRNRYFARSNWNGNVADESICRRRVLFRRLFATRPRGYRFVLFVNSVFIRNAR